MSATEIKQFEEIASKISDDLDEQDLSLAAEMCGTMSYMGYDSVVTRAAFVQRCQNSGVAPKQALVKIVSLFLERGTKLDFDPTTKTDEDGNQVSVRGLTGVSSKARAQIQALKTLLSLRTRTPAGTPPEVLSVGRIIAAFADVAAQIVSSMVKSGIPLRTPVKPQGLMPAWFICPQFCSLIPDSASEQFKSDVKQWYMSYDKVINRGKQSKKVEDYYALVTSNPFKTSTVEQEALWNKITGRAALAEARDLYTKGKYADPTEVEMESASSSSSSAAATPAAAAASGVNVDPSTLTVAIDKAKNSRNAGRLVGKLLGKDKAGRLANTAVGAIAQNKALAPILTNISEITSSLSSAIPDKTVMGLVHYDEKLFNELKTRKATPADFDFE